VQRAWCPVAVLELLTGAAWTLVVAAGHRRRVDWLSRFLLRGAASEPVGMDIASGGGDQVNKGLIS
jgi:hypothetical protein